MQPLQPGALHPRRRAPRGAGQEVEPGADAKPGAARAALGLDGGREQLLARRAEGEEHEPGGVVQDKADGVAHRAPVALEVGRRVVVGERGEAVAGAQRRHVFGPEADDRNGRVAGQAREQAGGEVAAGDDGRGQQAKAARRLGDDAGIKQPQQGAPIDRGERRVTAQAHEVVGVRRDDVAEGRVVRAAFDPACRALQRQRREVEPEQADRVRRPHRPSRTVSRPSERVKLPDSPEPWPPVPRVLPKP